MAHHVEPMDVDCMDSDFDNKENSFHHSNVLPCTEKGYEELDVSEVNMKLRYSVTPASSPMSKSYTASLDNRNLDIDDSLNCSNENGNLTRSLNSTMTKNDSVIKSLKSLPLQSLPTEQFIDGNGNPSVLRHLDSTLTNDANVTVTVSGTNDIDENLSVPSSSSSALHTPEATTPTKDITKDGASPIMRGLKSVLNMFRSSQSPIAHLEGNNITVKEEVLSPADTPISDNAKSQAIASTPIAAHRTKDGNTSKRSSPYKDSIVFNDDLETELNWKDETTILFSEEKIPIHKLFFQQGKSLTLGSKTSASSEKEVNKSTVEDHFNATVQFMDISFNESVTKEKTMTVSQVDTYKNDVNVTLESDSEFVDCETTFTKNESQVTDITEAEGNNILSVTDTESLDYAREANENTAVASQPGVSDITSMSFLNEEYKYDVTGPSECSDYSKETTELLSELEKLEENLSSKAESSDTNANILQDSIPDIKAAIEHQSESHEFMRYITMADDKQADKLADIVEDSTATEQNDITQSKEPKITETPAVAIVKLQYLETNAKSENKDVHSSLESITIPDNGDVSQVLGDIVSKPQISNAHEKIKETVQDINNMESQSIADISMSLITAVSVEVVSKEIPDVVLSELSNVQSEIMPETINVVWKEKPAEAAIEKLQYLETNAKSENKRLHSLESIIIQDNGDVSQVLGDTTIDSKPEITNAHEKIRDNVQDVNNMESQSKADNSMSLITAESVEIVSKEIHDVVFSELSNLQSEIMPETINVVLTEKPADVPLPVEENPKEPSESLTVDKTNVEVNVLQTENPSDIPLPDEDDIDKEVIIDEVVTIAPTLVTPLVILDMATTLTKLDFTQDNISNTSVEDKIANISVLPEVLNATNFETAVIHVPELIKEENTESKLDVTKTFVEKPLKTSLDNKIGINSVLPEVLCIPTETTVVQLLEIVDPANIPDKHVEVTNLISKLDVTEKFDDEALDLLLESKIESDIVLPDTNNVKSLEMATQMPSDETVLTFVVTETINDSLRQNLPDNKIGDNVSLPEEVSTSNTTASFDQTYEHIANDANRVINNLTMNTFDVTMTDDHSDQTENKTYDIESMDITMNESLNQTHVLPDLVNQTVAIPDENLQKATTSINFEDTACLEEQTVKSDNVDNVANNTVACDLPKQEEVAPHKEISDSDKPLNITAVNNNNENDVEDIRNAESLSPNTVSVQQNEKSIDHENQSLTVMSPNVNIKSDLAIEILLTNKINNDSYVKLCHEQPTERCKENAITDITTVDEEIIVSGNNSPYVSLMADVDTIPTEKIEATFVEIENPSVANTNIPSSPPIVSRGYNFNFDEMDDPFATKTKIRMSPPADTPTKPIESEQESKRFEVPRRGVTNRRKSQNLERKKPVAIKKKFNTSFDTNTASKTSLGKIDATTENAKDTQALHVNETITTFSDTTQVLQHNESNVKTNEEEIKNSSKKSEKSLEISEENKSSIDFVATESNEVKTTSSSEQSTYYSATGASSTDSFQSKNVFNLPEIDDINFNPFATKSKMRQSPPPDMENANPFATKSNMRQSPERDLDHEKSFATKAKIKSCDSSMIIPPRLDSTATVNEGKPSQFVEKLEAEDKMETELMEKDTSANINNTTSSSKTTENDILTTREVNTEDEDTAEGPFLDADVMDKMSDFDADNVDMMQFNDLPVQAADDNIEEAEMFIDAEAFELLLNQKSNIVTDSGKESLFLKFDPLFAKRVSADGVLAALSKVQRKQSTPTKPVRPSLRNEASPIAGPSNLNVTYEGDNNVSQESNDDANVTVSKPMMVVTPAVNPAVTPRNKTFTPNRLSNRRSVTFTSPAIAVIDRLLSLSANDSLLGQDTTVRHTTREHNEADLALTQLRELLAEKEISVYNLRSESKELKDRLATMETQVRILEADGQERLRKIKDLNELLAEKTNINKRMAAVVEEYERTIASLIAQTEQDKKRNAEERIRLINERDEQTSHLASMEVSFSDLHSKYEKSKQVILAWKANEEIYKKSLKDFQENVTKMQTNYEMLKQHATSKLNHSNQELEKMKRAHEAEVVKLNAMIKRKDLHITSLEESLIQKTKANEELTAICDELINKVG